MKKIVMLTIVLLSFQMTRAQYWDNIRKKKSTLGVEEGFEHYQTPHFKLTLVRASQTVAALLPLSGPDLDYTPGERINIRDKDSLYHLGDLNLRIRKLGGTWESYSTAWHRQEVEALPTKGNILAAADLKNTFAPQIPVQVKRFYEVEGEDLILRFNIKNRASSTLEIGALGVPMVFNNILEGKSLEEAHRTNVFFDPYMGEDAGYLEVKRLDGKGPILLVMPHKNMPFENYRPLLDDLDPRSIVFEGFHEWMSHSKAYADQEWQGVEQWNEPTAITLQPNESRDFSLKFVLAPKIRKISETIYKHKQPIAYGSPGYVLPKDVQAKLFLKYDKPIDSIKVFPNKALSIAHQGQNKNNFEIFRVNGNKWGPTRVDIVYKDGKKQTIHYKVIKPETEVVDDFGHFLTTEQWYDDPTDLFERTPSVISYDYEKKEKVLQDPRVWVAGLSDEAGAGSWLGAIMKQLLRPNKAEVIKLERFINETLWGGIQYDRGDSIYGVKKSVFYYEPKTMPQGSYHKEIDYSSWSSWDKEEADNPGRSYNYPHVTAAYWVMYRLANYYEGFITSHKASWFLSQAYHTAMAMDRLAPYYAQFGQMEGTIFLELLKDLIREGESEKANKLTQIMKKRMQVWDSIKFPFGSEMPWDSTGQEEVFMWSDYFGYDDKAKITLNAILAYMPSMPHWAYNGSARRYWDFVYAGKLRRIERQLHHYESGLSAIPLLKQFRTTPEDTYLLKTGYAGVLGAISNITKDGFGPSAFHSFPSTLAIDGISGDYGSGFLGYALNSGTYLINDKLLGWLVYGGNLTHKKEKIEVQLSTAGKNKFFLGPEGLWLTLDAGNLEKVTYNQADRKVTLVFGKKSVHMPKAYLRSNKDLGLELPTYKGAYIIELSTENKQIEIDL